jgi:hypothetical protein
LAVEALPVEAVLAPTRRGRAESLTLPVACAMPLPAACAVPLPAACAVAEVPVGAGAARLALRRCGRRRGSAPRTSDGRSLLKRYMMAH